MITLMELRFSPRQSLSSLLLIGMLLSANPGAFADTAYHRVYDASARKYYYVPETTWKQHLHNAFKNPVVKQSAIGAGVGVGSAVITGKSSALKGAGVGALVGAGTGLIDKSEYLKNHPYAKTSLKGAAIGTGVSTITEHGSKLKGAAVGAAAGAGLEAFRKFMNKPEN